MSLGRAVFVTAFTGVVTVATVGAMVKGLYWVKDSYGWLPFTIIGIGGTMAFVGIAVLVDIRKGLYQPRDLFRWPPIWLRFERRPDKHS